MIGIEDLSVVEIFYGAGRIERGIHQFSNRNLRTVGKANFALATQTFPASIRADNGRDAGLEIYLRLLGE